MISMSRNSLRRKTLREIEVISEQNLYFRTRLNKATAFGGLPFDCQFERLQYSI